MERFRFLFGWDQKSGMEWLLFDSAHHFSMHGEITSTYGVSCSFLQQYTIKIKNFSSTSLYFRYIVNNKQDK
jgi:hypothetical protein